MDIARFTIYYYRTTSGRCPFRDWLDSLDGNIQVTVDARLTRIRRGLIGDSEYLGGGVFELKIHAGPGFRIYYGRDGDTIIILLDAGRKKSQTSDIDLARGFWQDYVRRARE